MAQLTGKNVARLTKIETLITRSTCTSRADVRKIALMCLDAEAEGKTSNVWHVSAQFYETRCNCAPCVRSR